MGKSKVYLNSKIILFIFAILIALACSKKLSAAETATFAISNVTIGQKTATVTKNTKDDSVYTAQVDERSIGDGYIISGKADADAQISATDFEGKEFSVKRNGTDFNIEKEETKSYNINGTSVCYITVKKGTVSEKYKVLISGLSNWDNIKETYIADTTNDEINYFDNDTVIQGSSSADTSYREVTVKDQVKQCSVFRWTNHKKTESYSANAMEWLSNGENYVRINGENFQRFESSASYSDTFQSPVLSLKKGLNIIEMYTAEWNVSALDTASETMPEGLKKTNLKGYSCAVYLVYSNGTEQIIEPIEGEHYYISSSDYMDNPEEAHGWHSDMAILAGHKNLTPENKFGAVCLVDSPDVDYSKYTYKIMGGTNAKAALLENMYKDKVYALLLIENNAVIQGDDVDKKTANALIEYGPVKVDNDWPELFLGKDSNNLSDKENISLDIDAKEIFVKATDDTSGICKIQYSLENGEWTTVYDAAKNDNIDVDNKCGLSEKNIKIPVDEKASVMHVKVIDVAGNETISTVKIIKKSQFSIEPKTIIGNDANFTLNLKLNGNTIASVMNGEDTLEDTSYEVDSEKETLTLKKEYLEKLEAGEHRFTIKFSNDGQLLDSDLKMTLSIDSSDNQLKKLSDKVNVLDDITLDKESDVEEAKEFYDNMSNALQNQVSDELQKKLSDASEKISALKEDKAKAQKVEDKVRAIGKVDLSKETVIKEARNAYEALTDSQKAFVSQEVLQELQNAESLLQKLKETNVNPRPSDETNVQKLNFKVKKQTTTSITLKWNKISVADGYQLRRYDKSKKKYVVVTNLKKDQNTYTFKKLKGKKGKSLADGTVYKLNLRSYSMENGKRIYKQSEVITAVTSPMKTSLKVDGVSRNKIKISWKKIRRTTGYKIYIKEGKKSKYRLAKQVNKSNKTKIVIFGLKKGKTYFVKVYSYKKAANLNVLSKKSNVKKVRIK